jgi:hypothetical protein
MTIRHEENVNPRAADSGDIALGLLSEEAAQRLEQYFAKQPPLQHDDASPVVPQTTIKHLSVALQLPDTNNLQPATSSAYARSLQSLSPVLASAILDLLTGLALLSKADWPNKEEGLSECALQSIEYLAHRVLALTAQRTQS